MKITKKFIKSWQEFNYNEQMANIGSEAFRAIKWRKKGNENLALNFFKFAIQLFDLTIKDPKNKKNCKEVLCIQKIFCHFFTDGCHKQSADDFWNKYFYSFNYAARLHT